MSRLTTSERLRDWIAGDNYGDLTDKGRAAISIVFDNPSTRLALLVLLDESDDVDKRHDEQEAAGR